MPEILTVLVVDDSAEDRETYKRMFLKHSRVEPRYFIREAESGEEGLAALREAKPDCVMLDYRLPDLDGLEFLEEIRDARGDPVVPVVMLTGEGNEAVAVDAMKLGALDYLTKGQLSPEALDRAVSNAIEKYSLRAKLKEVEEEHRQFAHTAAHDLKAPLRHICSYCEILQTSCAAKLTDKEQRQFEHVQRAAARMTRLVSDLLEYATVEANGTARERVDLRSVLADVTTLLGNVIEETSAEVRAESLPAVVGHRALLAQLFQNLLSNALKFRGEDAPRLIISAERCGEDWRVSVKDNGIGIASDLKDQIFEPFRRLHTQTEYEGSGIGLATCSKVVKAHGGSIWVESEVGSGSTFHFTLPAADSTRTDVSTGEKARLLVVDDSPGDLDLTRALLSETFHITTVDSPEAALEFLEKEKVSAVLSDYDMPTNKGTWLLQQVKDRHPSVTRLLTSSVSPADLQRYIDDGVVESFFPKIVERQQLQAAIRRGLLPRQHAGP